MHPYVIHRRAELIAAVVFPSQSKIEIWHLEKDEKVDTFGHQSSGPIPFVRFSETWYTLSLYRIIMKSKSGRKADPPIKHSRPYPRTHQRLSVH